MATRPPSGTPPTYLEPEPLLAPPNEICPKCGVERTGGSTECVRCGVIFSRCREPRPGPPAPPRAAPRAVLGPAGRLTAKAWQCLGIGLVMALVLMLVPLLRFVVGYLAILVHEMGHALFAWSFGYPAIPAFDFLYGGGITIYTDRSTILLLVVFALLAYLLYFYRSNRLTLAVLGAGTLVYALLALTDFHQLLITSMGHGTELVFAGIFLFRAMKGSHITHAVEQPLYAGLGFFILFHNLQFAHRLITSDDFREVYAEGKGGLLDHDFTVIGRDFLGVGTMAMGQIFLFCCLLTLALTWLVFRYEETLKGALVRLLTREARS